MAKVFIYHEYDLLEELNEALNLATRNNRSWSDEYYLLKGKISKIANTLRQSTEVMIEK